MPVLSEEFLTKCREQLHRHEGLRLKPYKDTVDKWTWGVGRNLDDVGLTKSEILVLLQEGPEKAVQVCLGNDISRVIDNLDQHCPWWVDLDEPRKGVLVNMCFNLGISRLLAFRNTLRLIRERKYSDASVAMLASRWAQQVGRRAISLSNQMKEGIWK